MGLILLVISFAFVALVRASPSRRRTRRRRRRDRVAAADRVATRRALGRRASSWSPSCWRSSPTSCSRRSGPSACRSSFAPPSDTEVGGIGPILWNSIYILVLTLIFTVPLGILGGIYMAEYAGDGPRHQRDPLQPGADQLGAVDRRRPVRPGAVRQCHRLGLHGAERRPRADGLQPAAHGAARRAGHPGRPGRRARGEPGARRRPSGRRSATSSCRSPSPAS